MTSLARWPSVTNFDQLWPTFCFECITKLIRILVIAMEMFSLISCLSDAHSLATLSLVTLTHTDDWSHQDMLLSQKWAWKLSTTKWMVLNWHHYWSLLGGYNQLAWLALLSCNVLPFLWISCMMDMSLIVFAILHYFLRQEWGPSLSSQGIYVIAWKSVSCTRMEMSLIYWQSHELIYVTAWLMVSRK